MNLILFDRHELHQPLPCKDPRARHILEVLRFGLHEPFDIGLRDGPRGKAEIVHQTADRLYLSFSLDTDVPELYPVTLIIGLPRPQTARRLLRETTAMGASTLYFVQTDKGEASYRTSRLWTTGEYERHLIQGAEQAFCTRVPVLKHFETLQQCLDQLPSLQNRVALDNYEALIPLSNWQPVTGAAVLALGAERGWSNRERNALREHGFTLTHLGPRVLKTETATIAGVTLTLAKMGHI